MRKKILILIAICELMIISAAVVSAAAGSHHADSNPVFDNECHACHAPHKAQSGKLNILSEENLCFSCHTAFGASVFNTLQYFQGTATYSAPDGRKYNTRHDIFPADQTFSGAKIECINCHNPHLVDSQLPPLGKKVIADPNPNNGRIPAAGRTFPTSTFKTEFCFECHDNSFPTSVRAPNTALVNIYSQWSSTDNNGDGHGMRMTNGAYLKDNSPWSAGAVMQCSDCHVTGNSDDGGHGGNNLFQLKEHVCGPSGCNSPADWLPGLDGNTTLRVTNVNSSDASINGRNFCLACHNRNMGGSTSCITCHKHGVRGRF